MFCKKISNNNPGIVSCKHGFTLAETLLTIGIVSIVAVMTIPNLLTFFRIERYSVSFKKAIATLAQVALTSAANFDLDYAAAGSPCSLNGAGESPTEVFSFCALFNGSSRSRYIGPLENVVYAIVIPRIEGQEEIPQNSILFDNDMSKYIGYELAEGTMIGFSKVAAGCHLDSETMSAAWIHRHPQCIGFIDVTGTSGPNRVVNCDEMNSSIIDVERNCTVPFDTHHWTDIYPVIFHNATAIPATPASRYVLQKTKSTTSTDKDFIERPD